MLQLEAARTTSLGVLEHCSNQVLDQWGSTTHRNVAYLDMRTCEQAIVHVHTNTIALLIQELTCTQHCRMWHSVYNVYMHICCRRSFAMQSLLQCHVLCN